ncbi:MAG: RluA family pseudouridine synthase [Phycisphaerales bacterium]|nr:RluA family pseudouridine synthase [Phycisphaerales bacterium]
MPLRIVRSTPLWIVIDKPSGLLSVPGKGPEKADCVVARVRREFPGATGTLMVHRLDMDTSGLLLVALDAAAQRDLSLQFEERRVHKEYTALLSGRVTQSEGDIRVPIRLDVDRRPHQIADFTQGKTAHTRFRVLERGAATTRVWFQPLTGRSHQLRVHAALPPTLPCGRPGGLGCPILGDPLYGDGSPAPRLMLHAAVLQFTDPATGDAVRFESPTPF